MPRHEAKGGWLRPVSETCLRLIVVALTVAAVAYAAAGLRLVVLPLLLAVVLATLLYPSVRWLVARRAPEALATATVLVGALLVAAAVLAIIVPQTVNEFGALDVSVAGGIDIVQRWLTDGPSGCPSPRSTRGSTVPSRKSATTPVGSRAAW